jgi:hypothetical protein
MEHKMRVNIFNYGTRLGTTFFNFHLTGFAEEYFISKNQAHEYVLNGKQGLNAFVNYLKGLGYSAEAYHLEPNKDLFKDVGDKWIHVSRSSPSAGFVIAYDDPQLVEFKLKHL